MRIVFLNFLSDKFSVSAIDMGGAIYIYGDGFQYVRPWLTDDPNPVISIIPLYPNKILVAFSDNSLVAMDLPTLEVIDLLPSSWLPLCYGDLSALHSDLYGEKNFVYLGTTEGLVFVLELTETALRICDYQITKVNLGISNKSVTIADLQLSPKDEKYLAIGLDGETEGFVMIYDLNKQKISKQYTTPTAISSLVWHHSGDILYAGK